MEKKIPRKTGDFHVFAGIRKPNSVLWLKANVGQFICLACHQADQAILPSSHKAIEGHDLARA